MTDIHNKKRKKKSIRLRFYVTVFAGFLALLAIFSLKEFGPWLLRQYQDKRLSGTLPEGSLLEVVYLDVGQADAALLLCDGETMLIDTGGYEDTELIISYLYEYEVDMIEYLVLTHSDSDHIGGAADILREFEVEEVFFSDFEKENSSYLNLMEALEEEQLTAWLPDAGYEVELGGATVTFLGPVGEWDTPNNTSICLRVDHGVNSFLFTGDAEAEAEEELVEKGQNLRATVYKVGHHGSYTSSTELLLNAIQPQYAVISCGEGNDYGHPHDQTLRRLEKVGAEIFRTDTQGTITFISDGKSLTNELSLQNQELS
ncbi:MAG: MBL fold metallo-hydrolase [Lachnospiraceae bacterium]|nr:MBL fold metallo-hydrolase [Lachnospiraceae bacterium]